MHPIPYFPSENDDYCGPAVLQMTLASFGISATQDELALQAGTPRTPDAGTAPSNIVEVLKSYGCSVTAHENATLAEIENALAKSAIVIVCFTEPAWEWGHYAIVTSVTNQSVELCDPDSDRGACFRMSREEFERRWRDPLFTKTERWAAFVEAPSADVLKDAA